MAAKLIIDGLNFLTRATFVWPASFLALAFLWTSFSEKEGYSRVGSCAIPNVATGVILKHKKRVNGEMIETSGCTLSFLPGHWEAVAGQGYWNCKAASTGERGHLSKIRTPGELGIKVTEVETCSVSRDLR